MTESPPMHLLRLLLLSLLLASCTSHKGFPPLKSSEFTTLMDFVDDDTTVLWLWARNAGEIHLLSSLSIPQENPFFSELPEGTRQLHRTFREKDLPQLLALCDRKLQSTSRPATGKRPTAFHTQRLRLFKSRLEAASTAFVLRHQIHRHRPLPFLASDKDNLDVTIVHFGTNFPLDSNTPDHRVFIRFKDPQLTLYLLVPNTHTEADIHRALTDPHAPPVIVNDFTTRF
jgi:hypothetical protein